MSSKNKAVVTINKNKVKVTSKAKTANVSTSTVSNSTSTSNAGNKAVVSVTNPKVVIGGIDDGSRTTIDGSLKYTGGNDIEITDDNVINFTGEGGSGTGTGGLNESEVDARVSIGITNAPANPDTTLKYNVLKTGGFLFEEGDVTGTRTAYTGALTAIDGIKTYYFDDSDDSWYDTAINGTKLIGF